MADFAAAPLAALHFKGTKDEFKIEAVERLIARQACSQRTKVGHEIFIYDDAYCERLQRYYDLQRQRHIEVIGREPTPVATCRIAPTALGGGHCRLTFTYAGDWALVKKQVEQLIADLMADEWIEAPAADKTSVAAAPPGKKQRRKRTKAHEAAVKRLLNGESREKNFYQWREDYKQETGLDPEERSSGAAEIYRKSVWQHYQKLTGNN